MQTTASPATLTGWSDQSDDTIEVHISDPDHVDFYNPEPGLWVFFDAANGDLSGLAVEGETAGRPALDTAALLLGSAADILDELGTPAPSPNSETDREPERDLQRQATRQLTAEETDTLRGLWHQHNAHWAAGRRTALDRNQPPDIDVTAVLIDRATPTRERCHFGRTHWWVACADAAETKVCGACGKVEGHPLVQVNLDASHWRLAVPVELARRAGKRAYATRSMGRLRDMGKTTWLDEEIERIRRNAAQ